jgi:hypothetical protein
MKTKKQTLNWRKSANDHAAHLEKKAAAARLFAMADDPLDGLAAVWDVASLSLHNATARIARRHGHETSAPPAPVSRLLNGFIQQLRDKTLAIVMHLRSDETERLVRIRPGFVAALQANEPDVMLLIRDLLPRDPEVIALWLRAHLDILEQRFAS